MCHTDSSERLTASATINIPERYIIIDTDYNNAMNACRIQYLRNCEAIDHGYILSWRLET